MENIIKIIDDNINQLNKIKTFDTDIVVYVGIVNKSIIIKNKKVKRKYILFGSWMYRGFILKFI